MSKRHSISDEINEVSKEVESYIQNRIDLTKLQIAEDLSRFVSAVAIRLVLYYIAFFVLLFISTAAAYAIGSYLESTVLGFIIIAGFYFIIGLVFYLLKGVLVRTPIIKSFVHMFFPSYNNYDKK